jgi:hypothetical protein
MLVTFFHSRNIWHIRLAQLRGDRASLPVIYFPVVWRVDFAGQPEHSEHFVRIDTGDREGFDIPLLPHEDSVLKVLFGGPMGLIETVFVAVAVKCGVVKQHVFSPVFEFSEKVHLTDGVRSLR